MVVLEKNKILITAGRERVDVHSKLKAKFSYLWIMFKIDKKIFNGWKPLFSYWRISHTSIVHFF